MNVLEVIRNEFLHNLGEDHIAVDHTGTPIARASTHEAVKQAAPTAAAYFSGAEIAAAAPETEPAQYTQASQWPIEIVHSADNDTPVTVTETIEPVEESLTTDSEPAVADEGDTDTQEPFDLGINETPKPPKDAA